MSGTSIIAQIFVPLKRHRVEHENSDGYREIRTELKGKSDSCFFLKHKAL